MHNKKITMDLLVIYDDFVEFNDYCSFLCDAVSALATESLEAEPDTHTVMGLKRQCSDLKERADKLEGLLKALYQHANTSTIITPIKPSA